MSPQIPALVNEDYLHCPPVAVDHRQQPSQRALEIRNSQQAALFFDCFLLNESPSASSHFVKHPWKKEVEQIH